MLLKQLQIKPNIKGADFKHIISITRGTRGSILLENLLSDKKLIKAADGLNILRLDF